MQVVGGFMEFNVGCYNVEKY